MKWLHSKTDPTGNSSQYVYKRLDTALGIPKVYVSVQMYRHLDLFVSYADLFNVFDVYGAAGNSYPYNPPTGFSSDNGGGIWAVGDPVSAGPIGTTSNLNIGAGPFTVTGAFPKTPGIYTIE